MTLGEKVERLIAASGLVSDCGPYLERVQRRIAHEGAEEYALPGGGERHETATPEAEALNYCEELEDALAYAANAYALTGNPRWTAVPSALAVLWRLGFDLAGERR
jgi:hypothetical protein